MSILTTKDAETAFLQLGQTVGAITVADLRHLAAVRLEGNDGHALNAYGLVVRAMRELAEVAEKLKPYPRIRPVLDDVQQTHDGRSV